MTRFAVRDRKLASLIGFVYGITFVRMAFSDVMLSLVLTSLFLMFITSLRHLRVLHSIIFAPRRYSAKDPLTRKDRGLD